MVQAVIFFYDKFGFLAEKLPESLRKKVSRDLFQAGMFLKPEAWLSLCLGFSIITFIISSLVVLVNWKLFWLPIILSFLVFYSLAVIPASRKKKKAKVIEKELTQALRLFVIRLEAGNSFEECLKKAGEENNIIGKEFRKILAEAKISSVPEALDSFSKRTDSLFVKKTISVLTGIYSKGSSSSQLLRLAEEREKELQAKMKEYGSKSLFYSLFFIVFSAVLPSFFQAAGVIGGLLLGFSITPLTFLITMTVLFPTINAVVLWFITSKKP